MIGAGLAASLGLKALGIGKSIGGFIKANWKIILPIILVVAFYFFITDKISDAREEGYNSGVEFQIKEQKKQVDAENKRNREFEAMLSSVIGKFGKEVVEETITRMASEQKIQTKINTIIKDNPIYTECKVDQEVLDARNEIRKLGPQEYPIRIDLTGGSE